MQKQLLIFCFMALGIINPLMSQSTWVGINRNKPAEADINLVNTSINQTRIHFSLDGFNETTVRTHRGAEYLINVPGGVQISEKGMPDLGKLFTDIIIPDADEMEISVVNSSYKEFTNIEVAPSKGHFTRDINPEDVPYIYGEAYNQDAFWPSDIAQLEDPFILRDFRGQTVTIFPFQYNPVTKTLRVYTDIVVEVKSNGKQGLNILARNKEISAIETEFKEVYNHFFLNMEYYDSNKYLVEEEGSMLIIAYDDFAEAMIPFVDWKKTIGRKTTLVTKSEVGSSATEFKDFINNYYSENPDLTYLLLVGDAQQIPTQLVTYSGTTGHSDIAYGFLEGSDQYTELFVGRFSAENVDHVETQVQRVIHYERDITENDTWLSTGMGIARNEGAGGGHNGEADYVHMDHIRDTLLNFTYDEVYRDYDGGVPSTPNTSAVVMSEHVNAGVSIMNYCNHGSVDSWSVGGFSNTHVNALVNTGKLPFIWSVACINGAFVDAYCFAEAWMRATHEGEPSGAIGTMMSSINQPWQPPMTGQDEMVTILAEKRDHIKRTFGGLSFNGSMKMISAHGGSGVITFATWNMFGDPSLLVRTGTPQTIAASYEPVIFMTATSFDLAVEAPNGSTVAITKYDQINDEIEILGTAAVQNGLATVEFAEPFTEPGVLTLTITGFNMVTYIDDNLQLIPPDGPYVIFDQYIINDQEGNNNNQADYNELISLDFTLKNVGIEAAQGVSAVLSSEDEYITVISNETSWGNIPEEENLMVENAFSFRVAENIPDNHKVLFYLTANDSEGNEWNSEFLLTIHSPQFSIADFIIDDGEQGNSQMDPGETAQLVVRYTNQGSAPAMAPVAALEGDSPYFVIIDETVEPGVILPGEYADVEFAIQANPSAPEGTYVNLLINIEDGAFFESQQLLIIGQQPEVTIGDGEVASVQYPFYNYYKANRSQMLYTAEELGNSPKTITDIAFDIIQVSSSYNEFPNFQIRMKNVSENSMTNFISTSESDIVFSASSYQMPQSEGWHVWDLDQSFNYDGESNLLIEVVWGLLPNWANPYYRVNCTSQAVNMVAYGHNDNNAVPSFNGTSADRPNVWLSFESESVADAQPVTFTLKDNSQQPIENAFVKIASYTMTTNAQGIASVELLPGNYYYIAGGEGYGTTSVQAFEVFEGQPLNLDITLNTAYKVTFNIYNPWDHDMSDAVITIAGVSYEAGEFLIEMETGTHSFKVNAQYHYEYTGEFTVVDQDITVDVLLIPDGTDVEELPAELVNVFPNPCTDYLNVNLPEGTKANLRVINILGETIISKENVSGSQSIKVNHLPAGSYFIQIETNDGKLVKKVSKLR